MARLDHEHQQATVRFGRPARVVQVLDLAAAALSYSRVRQRVHEPLRDAGRQGFFQFEARACGQRASPGVLSTHERTRQTRCRDRGRRHIRLDDRGRALAGAARQVQHHAGRVRRDRHHRRGRVHHPDDRAVQLDAADRRGRVRARDAGLVQAGHRVRRLGPRGRPLHPQLRLRSARSCGRSTSTSTGSSRTWPARRQALEKYLDQRRGVSSTTSSCVRAWTCRTSPLSHIRYAFQFDAALYARYLRKYATSSAASSASRAASPSVQQRAGDGFVESVTLAVGPGGERAGCSSTARVFARC